MNFGMLAISAFRKRRASLRNFALDCRILIMSGGEPTLHEELPNILRFAKRSGMSEVNVITNGTSDRVELMDALEEVGAGVSVSLHSHDPKLHDAITAYPGSHRRAVSFVEKSLSRGIKLRAGMVISDANAGGVMETFRFIKGLGVETVTFDGVRRSGSGKTMTAESSRPTYGPNCRNCVSQHLAISPRGDVFPCAWVGTTTGNRRETPLKDIAASPRRQEVVRTVCAETEEVDDDSFRPEALRRNEPRLGNPYCPTQYCSPGACRSFAAGN